MRFMIVLVFLLFATQNVNAKIYKWVDEKGTIHFSDKPYSEEAEEVNVKRTGIRITGNEMPTKNSLETRNPAPIQKSDDRNSQQNSSDKKENEITEDDYRITSNVGKMGADAIRIAGRISSGPRCENLVVEATAKSDTGLTASIKTTTRKVTSHGSATFEGVAKVTGSADDFGFWEVGSVKIRCADLPETIARSWYLINTWAPVQLISADWIRQIY